VKRKHSRLKQRIVTCTVLALALVSSVDALSCDDMREPVVRFIDFYIAAQRAEAPRMSLWERVIYGLAIAKASEKPTTIVDARLR
jgi:hypothetical protein